MRRKIVLFIFLAFSISFSPVQAQQPFFELERDNLASEGLIPPAYSRDMGETSAFLNFVYQDLKYTNVKGSYKKESFKIGDQKFMKFRVGDDYSYTNNNGDYIPLVLNRVAWYGLHQDKVEQYCLIEPIFEKIAPQIRSIQDMSLLADSHFNTAEDERLGLAFYKNQSGSDKTEYYALLSIDGDTALLLDAYLSDVVFEQLKLEIQQSVREAASVMKQGR